MTDLRKLSEAVKSARRAYKAALTTPNGPWALLKIRQSAAVSEYHNALEAEHRSGSLIPRSEYERVLALLADARADFGRVRDEALMGVSHGLGDRVYSISSGALSRIDDALAADAEARG